MFISKGFTISNNAHQAELSWDSIALVVFNYSRGKLTCTIPKDNLGNDLRSPYDNEITKWFALKYETLFGYHNDPDQIQEINDQLNSIIFREDEIPFLQRIQYPQYT